MATVYKYVYHCITENIDRTAWSETPPTACIANESHVIDTNSIRVIDLREPTRFEIKEENVPTGGNFRAITRRITAAANETVVVDSTFKYPITALTVKFNSAEIHEGDNVELIVSPDRLIGAIIAPVSASANQITISSPIFDMLFVGYYLKITNGSTTDDLGAILAINKSTNTLTMENPTVNAYAPGSNILLSIYVIREYTIGNAGAWEIGGSKIGGSSIPKDTIVRIIYYNNSADAKVFTAQLDLLY